MWYNCNNPKVIREFEFHLWRGLLKNEDKPEEAFWGLDKRSCEMHICGGGSS